MSGPARRGSREPPAGGISPSRIAGATWADLRALVRAHRARLTAGLALMLIGRLASMILPASTKWFVDDVIGRGEWSLLPVLAALAVAATLVDAATTFALSQVLGVAAQRAIADLRRDLAAHVLRLPIVRFDTTKTGVLISRILHDADGVRLLVGSGLVQLVGSVLTMVLALGVLVYLNWRLTLVTVIALGVFGASIAAVFVRLRPVFRERGAIMAELTGRLGETLSGIRVVKAYTAEARELGIFGSGVDRLFHNVARALTGVSAVTAASTLVVGVIAAVMMVEGGAAIRDGVMTPGDLVMYLSFTALMAVPVVQLASLSTQVSEALAGLDRIRELREMAPEDEGDQARAPIGALRGDVALDRVSFAYPSGPPVLMDVSFTAAAGTTTALVGSSGSGKSTLISLIMGFNRPTEGRVLVDGRDVSGVRLADFRRQLGVVLQEDFLFDGTIAENIAFGRPGAPRAAILDAARCANCDEFVQAFADGYDTLVGERGVRLSGGQRQRVAIARAILADPRILILDEATSSLDSASEALVQEGLRTLRRGRTTFVIAHRLSTIRSADEILVIEQGRIVERGRHADLVRQNGRYRELHDLQHRFEADRFVNPGEEFAAASTPDAWTEADS